MAIRITNSQFEREMESEKLQIIIDEIEALINQAHYIRNKLVKIHVKVLEFESMSGENESNEMESTYENKRDNQSDYQSSSESIENHSENSSDENITESDQEESSGNDQEYNLSGTCSSDTDSQ